MPSITNACEFRLEHFRLHWVSLILCPANIAETLAASAAKCSPECLYLHIYIALNLDKLSRACKLLTHLSLASFLWDIGGVPSGAILFAQKIFIEKLNTI